MRCLAVCLSANGYGKTGRRSFGTPYATSYLTGQSTTVRTETVPSLPRFIPLTRTSKYRIAGTPKVPIKAPSQNRIMAV